jgi:hypothetical protein
MAAFPKQVWDYVGDGYVHRLIQSKTDGKLVEVPAPAPLGRDDESCSSRCKKPSLIKLEIHLTLCHTD